MQNHEQLACNAEMVPKLLDTSQPVPEPPLVVVKELLKQRDALLSANETPLIQAVDGSFVSPLSKFLPSEGKHCHFKMLKPPKGMSPVNGYMYHHSLALDHAADPVARHAPDPNPLSLRVLAWYAPRNLPVKVPVQQACHRHRCILFKALRPRFAEQKCKHQRASQRISCAAATEVQLCNVDKFRAMCPQSGAAGLPQPLKPEQPTTIRHQSAACRCRDDRRLCHAAGDRRHWLRPQEEALC